MDEQALAIPSLPVVRAPSGYYTDAWRRLRRNHTAMIGLAVVGAFAVLAAGAPLLNLPDPITQDLGARMLSPSRLHWLGTDDLGRDLLSRIIYGGRVSLTVGIVSVGIALAVGTVLGLLGGYYGGWAESVTMRVMDVMLAFPATLLAIFIVGIRGPGLNNAMLAIGVINIPIFARIVRGSVLRARQEDYVEAARALGSSHVRIIGRHILPNSLAPVIVQTTLGVGSAVLEAAGLSFLGLGAQAPTPEWGAMLTNTREYLRDAPWAATFPGIAILLTVVACNLLGDGLRDALDPRLRK
ncbi:MAG: ABC transporter permease [Bacillati bacterium ANGP1]|uniref:ABC transporter permease n=1 Tax=Candidatus Segetimicrobium genomatis TaxID=2569760 RepID=A0A537KUD3_9BACT|nr:MAG: ABC transporter permease [Terrabacteria group bacterium ANGP1]